MGAAGADGGEIGHRLIGNLMREIAARRPRAAVAE